MVLLQLKEKKYAQILSFYSKVFQNYRKYSAFNSKCGLMTCYSLNKRSNFSLKTCPPLCKRLGKLTFKALSELLPSTGKPVSEKLLVQGNAIFKGNIDKYLK